VGKMARVARGNALVPGALTARAVARWRAHQWSGGIYMAARCTMGAPVGSRGGTGQVVASGDVPRRRCSGGGGRRRPWGSAAGDGGKGAAVGASEQGEKKQRGGGGIWPAGAAPF
jgi:hypothetical protein